MPSDRLTGSRQIPEVILLQALTREEMVSCCAIQWVTRVHRFQERLADSLGDAFAESHAVAAGTIIDQCWSEIPHRA